MCIGFLVFMIAMGVVRIRNAHKRGQHEAIADQEMAWDDSALTITVNPMDVSGPPILSIGVPTILSTEFTYTEYNQQNVRESVHIN
jgi:hypothetical protein